MRWDFPRVLKLVMESTYGFVVVGGPVGIVLLLVHHHLRVEPLLKWSRLLHLVVLEHQTILRIHHLTHSVLTLVLAIWVLARFESVS